MKLSTVLPFAFAAFLLFSCGMRKSSGAQQAFNPLSCEVESFTVRTEFPGVESDLVSVSTYSMSVVWKTSAEPRIVGLAFDSLMLEPNLSQSNRAVENGKLRLNFSRANYRSGSDVERENALPVSPLGDLQKDAYVLLLEIDGRMNTVALLTPEVLPSVYHP
jgi:hypothetical protein